MNKSILLRKKLAGIYIISPLTFMLQSYLLWHRQCAARCKNTY